MAHVHIVTAWAHENKQYEMFLLFNLKKLLYNPVFQVTAPCHRVLMPQCVCVSMDSRVMPVTVVSSTLILLRIARPVSLTT